MSRIGIQPISIPEGVTVTADAATVAVASAKGTITVPVPTNITVSVADNTISVQRANEDKLTRALHGTIRALLNNAVEGVANGWTRRLDFIGSGYRVSVDGNKIELHLGFSHPVIMEIPEGLEVKVVKNSITIGGVDRQAVGQFAAVIRALRKPEPYKGKGIRYHDEHVRRKVGKALKSGE